MAGGYRAIDSLRLEKGYRVWGADITPDETPYEAGLGFCVKLDKGDFIGRDALSRRAPSRAPAAVLPVLDDPRSVALGNEPVRVGGEVAGRVTSGGYGYTVGRSIAYAYLPAGARRARHGGRGGDLRRAGSTARSRTSRSRSPLRANPELDDSRIPHYLGRQHRFLPRSWSLRPYAR